MIILVLKLLIACNPHDESQKVSNYCDPVQEPRTDFKKDLLNKVQKSIENRRIYNYKTADI